MLLIQLVKGANESKIVKTFILLLFVNLILFAVLGILSVVIAFQFGIGASAGTEKYDPYILIPALVLQLFLLLFLYQQKKFIKNGYQLTILAATVLVVYFAGQAELIPF